MAVSGPPAPSVDTTKWQSEVGALMAGSPSIPPASTTRHALALILPLWRRYWPAIAGGVLALIAVDLCQLGELGVKSCNNPESVRKLQ